jgi:hypothetical protein
VLDVRLDLDIVELATNETFCVKNTSRTSGIGIYKTTLVYVRVVGVHGNLILCGITDKTFIVRKGDVGRRCAISLVVCDDLYTIILPNTNTTKGHM